MEENDTITSFLNDDLSVDRPRQFCMYLSRTFDEDPQLLQDEIDSGAFYDWTDIDKVMLLVSMAR